MNCFHFIQNWMDSNTVPRVREFGLQVLIRKRVAAVPRPLLAMPLISMRMCVYVVFFPLHWLLLLIFKCRFDPVIFASKRTLEQSFSLHLSIQHALRCAYAQITHQPHYPNQSQRYLTFTTAISNTHSVCSIREFRLHYHK